jgi:hypothetical protein
MTLLQLQVDSSSAKIFAQKLTHESIRDVYEGFNGNGVLYDNKTNKTNVVVVEEVKEGIVTIAAYADDKVQKWSIETYQPQALAHRLVKKFNLMCESGLYDSLFG